MCSGSSNSSDLSRIFGIEENEDRGGRKKIVIRLELECKAGYYVIVYRKVILNTFSKFLMEKNAKRLEKY